MKSSFDFRNNPTYHYQSIIDSNRFIITEFSTIICVTSIGMVGADKHLQGYKTYGIHKDAFLTGSLVFLLYFFSVFPPSFLFCVHCLHICNFRQHLQVSHFFSVSPTPNSEFNSFPFTSFAFTSSFFLLSYGFFFSFCVCKTHEGHCGNARRFNTKFPHWKETFLNINVVESSCSRSSLSMLFLLLSLFLFLFMFMLLFSLRRILPATIITILYCVALHLSFPIYFHFSILVVWCLKTFKL